MGIFITLHQKERDAQQHRHPHELDGLAAVAHLQGARLGLTGAVPPADADCGDRGRQGVHPQRQAVVDLIGKFGFEKVRATAEFAISAQGKIYAPTITNPYQLKIKLGDLMVYHKKQSDSEMLIL